MTEFREEMILFPPSYTSALVILPSGLFRISDIILASSVMMF